MKKIITAGVLCLTGLTFDSYGAAAGRVSSLSGARKEIARWKQERDDMAEQHDYLQRKNMELSNQIIDLRDRNNNLTSENSGLKSRVEELGTQNSELEKRIAELEERLRTGRSVLRGMPSATSVTTEGDPSLHDEDPSPSEGA